MNNKNIQTKKPESNEQVKKELQEIKSKYWDIKDVYPTVKTFAASLIQFCFYVVLSSAGIYVRIMDYSVDAYKFWILVAIGAILCTIPVFMYRYKFVLIVSLILSIAFGITSGNYAQSATGIDINSFYYIDLFAIFMMLVIGYSLIRKLANLDVKRVN